MHGIHVLTLWGVEQVAQSRPVDLAVGVLRKVAESHPAAREHIGGQESCQLLPDEGRGAVTTTERDICTTDGHAFEAIRWHCNDGRLLQQSQAVETGFNLAQLNSVTATFYLGVGSPQKIDEPVLSHFCQVAS